MRQGATVVLIDSSPAVLELGEQALREAGHHVLVTSDPAEAVAVTRTLRLDLVIADAASLDHFRSRLDAPQLLEIQDDEGRGRPPALCRPFSLAQLQDAVALALGMSK